MAIHAVGHSVILGVTLPIDNFADLASEHRRRFPQTVDVEFLGEQLRIAKFPAASIYEFVRAVCNWGGYAGIGGRIIKNNSLPAIRGALEDADQLLSATAPDLVGALRRMNSLHELGCPSFASKHLRFLRPDLCPVFDSVLRDALPYSFDPEGYGDFAADCREIARILEATGISNPWGRLKPAWFVADVESALFVHFNDWV
jgi:hypothetical protein